MIAALMTRPCVVVAVSDAPEDASGTAGTDDMGEPVERDDMSHAAPVEIRTHTVCEIQQTAAQELRGGGGFNVETWRVFLPADTPVTAASRIECEAQTFTLDGGPWLVRHPRTARISHIEATARLVS